MKTLTEIAEELAARIASRSNPSGLKAGDLDAYTTAEMKTKYDAMIPIDTMGISQVGDQSYFPLAIDGAADGAIGIPSFRNYAIIREPNGDFVGLRTATNAIKRGIYYAIARANSDAAITGVTPSSRQFNPGLPAGWEPLTVFASSNDVLYGTALNTSTGELKTYVAKINGTFDQKKHKASLVDGDLNAPTGTQFAQCALVGNTMYVMRYSGGDAQLIGEVYTIDITNIGNGTTLTSVRVTGITSTPVNGGTITEDNLVLARPWVTNARPVPLGSMFPRRVKLLTTQSGTQIRTLFEISWYIATDTGLTRDGLILYCMTYDTATKRLTMNAGATPMAYFREATGHVRFSGASSRATVDANMWTGYTRTGAGNNTVVATITPDGVVGVMWNDNNSIPYMASYKLASFTGSAFTELLKLNPTGTQPPMAARAVLDREVGPVTASGHVGFLSKTRVSFTKNDPVNPGYKKFGYADNDWDVTYRYKSDLVDVNGFPPTGRSADCGLVNNKTNFIAMISSEDSVAYYGGVLNESSMNRYRDVDPDTLEDITTSPAMSITKTELDRIANSYLQSVTNENKQSSYDKTFAQVIVPPQPSMPALAIAYGVNYDNLVLNWILYEITPPRRVGEITAGSAVKIADGAVTGVKNIDNANMTLQHVTYSKVSDGWLITFQPAASCNWVGNTGWFQFILGRSPSVASYSYVARVEAFGYYSESGPNYGIHPVWGIGYCDCAVDATMGHAGHIFNVLGNTVAALKNNVVTARYMVLSAIAAAGYNLYVNEPITVLMAGVYYTLPISRLNLQDILANPSNSTWYLSIVKDGDGVKLSASKTLQANNPNSLINIGTCITGATQIQTLALNKTTMLGNNVVA